MRKSFLHNRGLAIRENRVGHGKINMLNPLTARVFLRGIMVVRRIIITASSIVLTTIMASQLRAFILLALFFVACVIPTSALSEPDGVFPIRPRWKALNEDLEVSTLELLKDQPLASEMTIVRTRLRDYSVDVLTASDFGLNGSDAKTFCELGKGHVCINANFFDEHGDPLGLVVKNGAKKRKLHRGGSLLNGVFQVINGTPRIVERDKFIDGSVNFAVQAGPILIKDGVVRTAIRDRDTESKRAGICIDSKKRVVLFCSSPGLGGLSIATLQKILLDPAIACSDALNFDGGGSAQMAISLPTKVESSNSKTGPAKDEPKLLNFNGRDNVPVVLALIPQRRKKS